MKKLLIVFALCFVFIVLPFSTKNQTIDSSSGEVEVSNLVNDLVISANDLNEALMYVNSKLEEVK